MISQNFHILNHGDESGMGAILWKNSTWGMTKLIFSQLELSLISKDKSSC